MKQQLPATSAVPVALAAASMALAFLLLPSGGNSVRSLGVAPALGIVANDVAAVVESPAQAVTKAKAQPKSVASASVGVAATHEGRRRSSASSASSATPTAPAHRVVTHDRVSPKRTVTHAPTKPHAAPASHVVVQASRRGPGKAKALGHLKKAQAVGFQRKGKALGHRNKGKAVGQARKAVAAASSASKPSHAVQAGSGHAQAGARTADVPHGPPAVPPGHAKPSQTADGHGASNGRGGGK